MISEAQFRELLAQKAETKNLDFKETLNWNKAGNDDKCDLIKDVLAFFNTQDGGYIIFGVQDGALTVIGMNDDDFASFDTTKVNDFLQRYTDPPASCEVQKLTVDGMKHIVISIPEFKDVPIICKRDANSNKDPSKLILRAGGLYVRTEKATSVLVPSSEEMRDVINRALLKRSDQLLATIESLLRGKPKNSVDKNQELAKYKSELDSAHQFFKQALSAEFFKNGYWQLIAAPDVYNRERIPDIKTLLKFLYEAEVALRGWSFPHTDKDNKSNFADGRQSYTNFLRYLEAHRAYQSGLFIWRGAYRENEADFVKTYGKSLSFVNVIYEITEMFIFMKRYYERVAPDASIRVEIELNDLMDRALVATDFDSAATLGTYISKESKLVIEKDYTVAELRASGEELANKVVQKIFGVFNWNDPDPNMIRMWQQKLLSRTF